MNAQTAPPKSLRRGILLAAAALILPAGLILAQPLQDNQVEPWNVLVFGYTVVMLMTVVLLLFFSLLLTILALTRDARRMRRRLFRYLTLLISTVFAAILLDFVLPLFPSFEAYYSESDELAVTYLGWMPDKRLGFKARPNWKISYHFDPAVWGNLALTGEISNPPPTGERVVDVRLNTDADGFRNKEVPEHADILVLGDSFVTGFQIPDGEDWVALLQKRIGKSIYNAGHESYSPPQELIVLEKYGLPKKPNIILWGFYHGNDFTEAKRFEDFRKGRPAYGFLKASKRPFPYNRPIVKLLVKLLKSLFERKNFTTYPEPHRLKAGGVEKPIAFGVSSFYFLARSREETRNSEGWQSTCDALKKGKDLCDRTGTRMVLVYFPSKLAVYSQYALDNFDGQEIIKFVRPALSVKMKDMTGDELIEAIRKNVNNNTQVIMFEEFCRENDIEFINTQPALKKSLERGEWPYYCYDTHMNIVGQHVVAEVVCSYLNATEESTPSVGDTP